jgi:hypothetical protein
MAAMLKITTKTEIELSGLLDTPENALCTRSDDYLLLVSDCKKSISQMIWLPDFLLPKQTLPIPLFHQNDSGSLYN